MSTATVCRSCASANLMDLRAEMNIHLHGLRSLDQPSIFAFPTLVVCLDCGLTESILLEAELLQIRKFAPSVVRISL